MPEELMIKTYDADVKAIEGERALNVTITTPDVDRDGDIVEPKGAKLVNYRKNPVVLMAHDYRGLPIGKAKDLDKTDTGINAKVIFPEEGTYPLADTVYNLYRQKFMKAWSIGFIPIKTEDIVDEDEGKVAEHDMRRGKRIKTWELLEFSACAVPSNPNALSNMVEKGINIDTLKEAGFIEIEEKGEAIKLEVVEKPYPNEHACRIRPPGAFKPESFRRMTRRHDGKEYSVIMGRLKGETTLTEQAYRYPKDVWSVATAKKHCKDHKGIAFEPATERGEGGEESKDTGLFDIKELTKIVNRNKELIEENKELKEKNKGLELRAGAVLNSKNKKDLKDAQVLIQSVLDSAEVSEDSLEIEDEKDSKNDNTVFDLEIDTVDNVVIDEEEDEKTIEVDEEIISKTINNQMSYIMGKVKQSDTKNKTRKELTK